MLRDAFRPEFAEMVHAELKSKDVAWELNEAYFPDGYAHRHSNAYDRGAWSARLNATLGVFESEASAEYMGRLTGRDCAGETTGAPSWYGDGDHSLPHTDWVGQRTVAYVWHLTKGWKPEWGGALYWCAHGQAGAATVHPSTVHSSTASGARTTTQSRRTRPRSTLLYYSRYTTVLYKYISAYSHL